MKVCDVVLDSIWWDPRVRKQILAYSKHKDIELVCVGFKDQKYDDDMVAKIPCRTIFVSIDEKYLGYQKGLIRKIRREVMTWKAIEKAIIEQNPDIIHANNLNILIPAYKASKKLKCKLVYDSFEINVENYIGKRRNVIAYLNERIEKYIVHRIDLMVCVSKAAAKYFTEKYNIQEPLVITNSVLSEDILGQSPKKNNTFEVLNHGQFYEGRGYDIMAEANKLLADYPEIYLAIRGFGKLEPTLRKTVKNGINSERFCFYPRVQVDELIREAAHSHVGVAITEPICLNFKLSVSNKIFEYAAAGLPVIMSDIPEHRFLNEKYDFGIIMSQNTPEAFAEAVINLYQDKNLYSRLASNAVKMSYEMNWERVFKPLIDTEHRMVMRDSNSKGAVERE